MTSVLFCGKTIHRRVEAIVGRSPPVARTFACAGDEGVAVGGRGVAVTAGVDPVDRSLLVGVRAGFGGTIAALGILVPSVRGGYQPLDTLVADVGHPVSLVGGLVSLVGDSVALIGTAVALVSDPLALIGDRGPVLVRRCGRHSPSPNAGTHGTAMIARRMPEISAARTTHRDVMYLW